MDLFKKLYKLMKECFVITSYCNTPSRVEELKKCINNLKQFNIDILIHAHPLDSEVQKMATYYIYDATNPVIRDGSKVIVRWKWYMSANKLLTIPNPDYSYAVINQWVSSLKFLKDKNYDKIHVVNYDTFINEFVFRKHQDFLNEHDVVFEYTNYKARDYNANEFSKSNLIFVVFFSIKKSFVDPFTNELTLEKYLQSKDTMLETFLMEVIDKFEKHNKEIQNLPVGLNFSYKIKKFDDSQFKLYLGDAVETPLRKEECDVYTTISEANGFDLIKKTENNIDLYYVFGGNNSEYNKFEFFIFDIIRPINIIININGDITKVNNITDKYYSLITKYTINEITEFIDNDKLSIIIDGEEVKKEVINVMKFQGIHPKFQ